MSNNQPLTVTAFNNGVAQLAQSSRDLAARFGQRRTVEGQIALIREETAELLAATDDAHRVEELCDLVVVVCGFADAAENPIFELEGETEWYGAHNSTEFRSRFEFVTSIPSPSFIFINLLEEAYCHLLTIPAAAELFPAAVAAVVAKNAAKTDATHYLDSVTGKITKRRETTLVACPCCGLGYPPSDFVDGLCSSCVNAKQTSEGT